MDDIARDDVTVADRTATDEESPVEITGEITFDEQFYPARPKRLRPRARLRGLFPRRARPERKGAPSGENPEYVDWLIEKSMLSDATTIATQFSGQGSMWQNPFAHPDPRAAIEKASVWFTAYPISMITKSGSSFVGTLGDRDLWQAFERIGIEAIHTGPVKVSGGLSGWDSTPSVDGHFDRISTHIDEAFGTEEEFRTLCEVATTYGGTVIDDIVPGPHRQGRGLPAGRDEVPRLSRHLPHGGDRPEGLAPAAAGQPRSGLGQLRPGDRGQAGEGRLHHRQAAAGHLLRRGRQGDQLERDRPGHGTGRSRASLGVPALLQGRAAVASTGWTRRSPGCGW